MSHQVIRGAATALLIAAALAGCTKKTESTTATETTTATVTTAPTDPLAVNAAATYVSSAPVTVPEMKPTGDMAQAVKPSDPSKPATGLAPQMAPTGNEREPYSPSKK
jgi:hypothetical protein